MVTDQNKGAIGQIRNNVVQLPQGKLLNHELCRQCDHDKTCTSVCIAIEMLAKLAKERSPMAQLEYIYNAGTYLDLENTNPIEDI